MPIYDFKCEACGHIHEDYCKISERKEAKKCPKCDACSYMLVSTNDNSFKLRGEGWYGKSSW